MYPGLEENTHGPNPITVLEPFITACFRDTPPTNENVGWLLLAVSIIEIK